MGPGSVHPSGRLYELAVDAPIVPAPAWLLAMVARPAAPEPQLGLRFEDRRDRYLTRALEDAAEKVAAAAEGRRNWTLNREAFALAGLGLDLGTIAVELLAAAERAGLGRAEARRTLASGFRAGRRRPRAA